MEYLLLITQCRKKDKKAQLEFYRLFCKSVFNSCLRILNNPQEAEEVMQECLLKVLTEPRFLLESSRDMEIWLKRAAVNRSIDLYRKRRIIFTEIPSSVDYPEEEITDEENLSGQLEAIRYCLQQLPDGYRMIFTLRLIEGWEYGEIAAKLRLSESTVRSQLTRARQKLLHLIKEYNHEQNF